MSDSSVRSRVVGGFRVESLRNKLIRQLPLHWIMLQLIYPHDYGVLLRLKLNPVHYRVLVKARIVRKSHWSLNAQSLIETVSQI